MIHLVAPGAILFLKRSLIELCPYLYGRPSGSAMHATLSLEQKQFAGRKLSPRPFAALEVGPRGSMLFPVRIPLWRESTANACASTEHPQESSIAPSFQK